MSEFVGLWTLKRPACMHRRLGSTTLLQLAFLEESNPNFPWEQSEWDDTVIKQDQGGPQLTLSQRKVRFTVQRTVRSDGRHNQVGIINYKHVSIFTFQSFTSDQCVTIYVSLVYIWSMCDYLRFTRLHLINVWLVTFHSFTSDQCVTIYVSLIYNWWNTLATTRQMVSIHEHLCRKNTSSKLNSLKYKENPQLCSYKPFGLLCSWLYSALNVLWCHVNKLCLNKLTVP